MRPNIKTTPFSVHYAFMYVQEVSHESLILHTSLLLALFVLFLVCVFLKRRILIRDPVKKMSRRRIKRGAKIASMGGCYMSYRHDTKRRRRYSTRNRIESSVQNRCNLNFLEERVVIYRHHVYNISQGDPQQL